MRQSAFTHGLDPDPAVRRLVRRVHVAMDRVPAPACLCYDEAAYGQPILRLVTPMVLYEKGLVNSFRYLEYTAVLTRALQQQQVRITELESRLVQLEARQN